MLNKKIVYLDYAATTPVDKRVLTAMMPYFSDNFGNASSIHVAGSMALSAVDKARGQIALLLHCNASDVYFTSGATESDNLAILGLIRGIVKNQTGFKPHVIVSAIEHEAILEPVKRLANDGLIEVYFLGVDNDGLVNLDELKRVVQENTVLVSIMLANNEIGAIQPITEVASVIADINIDRKQKIYFHTDATQAPAYVNCDVNKLGVDTMSLSAHKIYGPKGVGASYVKKGTPMESLVYGGGQQGGVRSGTYNVSGIVGFGQAIAILADKKNQIKENSRIKKMRDYLIKGLKKKISKITVNGSLKQRLPNNASFIIPGVEGESMLLMLSQRGIAVSTGSACSSGSLEPSHVLLAIGVPQELAHGSLRVTLGRFTVKKDVDKLIKELPLIVENLRRMSPLK
ncbi:MAG: cysteine desulfurase family protein, partial [bacterium]